MREIILKLLLFLMLFFFTGCPLAPQKPVLIDSTLLTSNDAEMLSMPANMRTIDIRKAIDSPKIIVCSEPMPDVAMSNVLKLATEASQGQKAAYEAAVADRKSSSDVSNTIAVKGNYEAATTAMQLAGRTQVVLLAREFLYRNCVARANGWLVNAEFKQGQDAILNQITAMIQAETEAAKASEAQAKAVEAAINAELDQKAIDNVRAAVKKARYLRCLRDYEDCKTKAAGDSDKLSKCTEKFVKCSQ